MENSDTPYYRSNTFRVKYAIRKNLIRTYEDRDFRKWLSSELDQLLDKITVEEMTTMFHEDRGLY